MIAEAQEIERASELDGGPRTRERERMCAATRTVRPVSDLIRFVVGPQGEVVPDVKGKLPGRGIWITATRDALGEAIKRKAFTRSFKREVRLPVGLRRRHRTAPRAGGSGCFGGGWKGRIGRGRVRQSREGLGKRGRRRPVARRRSFIRRNPEARRGMAPAARRTACGDWISYLGAIGFGIEPPKCDTCSPARRPRERDLFGALSAPRTVSGR